MTPFIGFGSRILGFLPAGTGGQIGHLQVPHGMLKAGECDRTAN